MKTIVSVIALLIVMALAITAFATGSFTWSKAPAVQATVSKWSTGKVDISKATGPTTISFTGHSSTEIVRARYGPNSPIVNLTTIVCGAVKTTAYTTRAAYGEAWVDYTSIHRVTATARNQKGDMVWF